MQKEDVGRLKGTAINSAKTFIEGTNVVTKQHVGIQLKI